MANLELAAMFRLPDYAVARAVETVHWALIWILTGSYRRGVLNWMATRSLCRKGGSGGIIADAAVYDVHGRGRRLDH